MLLDFLALQDGLLIQHSQTLANITADELQMLRQEFNCY